jgi:hypothetical protein
MRKYERRRAAKRRESAEKHDFRLTILRIANLLFNVHGSKAAAVAVGRTFQS